MTDDDALLPRLDHLSAQLDSVEGAVRENKDQIAEVDRIAKELAEAQKALKAAQVELAAAQAASDKNARGAKWRNRAIAAVVMVVALVVGLLYKQAHDQEDARLNQRIASCKAYN